MKKLLVLFMGIVLIFAIAACGNKDTKSTQSSSPAATAAAGQQVLLKASNFKFDQSEYRVKKGEPVTITLDNTQGVHGASIKEFKVNLDNSNKTVTFTPDKAGSFPINCSIMCGSGHANMKTTLIVE
ncbi:cupredoxin domain-containing protein [Paenibacillus alginolyticus]|uniref:Cupredoxin domain-containing protein n=1 Tax=Paenibacillus alginolyticus TaxID=59839 RepID=A0ABT4G947_9BACL|nr:MULTISPECIES: cupredoxin domain-containing protein [Paenibacillus]MCY9666071.1 cupredoxin domain-containing protein [Paenibacillus alginolyticus]MCY9692706.1 cupredoxin domain-containing protein [Paenibacillus alginolyticus]MEC0146363.1 cupredoxin domain-containing protein [Paenibacillus alginolyticus]